MLLKTKLIVSGVVGVATVIGVLMTPFNAKKLPSVINENQIATNNAIHQIGTATTVIKQLEKKVDTDNQTIKTKDELINSLEDALIGAKNSSDPKNMTNNQKMTVLKSLLKSWGYSQREINIIARSFDLLNNWSFATVNNKQNTNNITNKTQKS